MAASSTAKETSAADADPAKAVTTLPVAVLVNRGTAGPAEIVAAAILENARGDIVGEKTFGDGSVPKTFDLPDGGALILSVAKYYSPSGKAIQDASVTPNVIVASEEETAGPEDEDRDLTCGRHVSRRPHPQEARHAAPQAGHLPDA
jgi:carboxyl-terminal processing protease